MISSVFLRVFSTGFSLFFVFARDVFFFYVFFGFVCFNYNFHLEMSIWSCFVDLYLDSFVFSFVL